MTCNGCRFFLESRSFVQNNWPTITRQLQCLRRYFKQYNVNLYMRKRRGFLYTIFRFSHHTYMWYSNRKIFQLNMDSILPCPYKDLRKIASKFAGTWSSSRCWSLHQKNSCPPRTGNEHKRYETWKTKLLTFNYTAYDSNILLTKHEGRTGRISARGLDSTNQELTKNSEVHTEKTEGRYSPGMVHTGPDQARLKRDLLHDWKRSL